MYLSLRLDWILSGISTVASPEIAGEETILIQR
jgi:hypothetical protein